MKLQYNKTIPNYYQTRQLFLALIHQHYFGKYFPRSSEKFFSSLLYWRKRVGSRVGMDRIFCYLLISGIRLVIKYSSGSDFRYLIYIWLSILISGYFLQQILISGRIYIQISSIWPDIKVSINNRISGICNSTKAGYSVSIIITRLDIWYM